MTSFPWRPALMATVVLAAAGAGPARGEEDFAARRALFAYDAKAGFDVKEVAVTKPDGASVRDLTFTAAPGSAQPTRAYLVVPEGRKGPFAGILWVHWLGEPATTNRTEFLKEAVALAPRGVVSLLVDAMWSDPKWYEQRVPDQDYESSIRQVIALRRALDLLASQPEVDKARLGFVGHDYGGMYGMLMAGLDQRPKAYVYVATASSLNDWAFFANQPASKAEYLRRNAVLELTDYLRQVKNASTLFQFASNDVYVSRSDSLPLLGAAADPKERKFYEAGHDLVAPGVVEDRDAFLSTRLGLVVAPGR